MNTHEASLLLATLVSAPFGRLVAAQSPGVSLAAGQRVALRIPPAAFSLDTSAVSDHFVRTATVARTGSTITINGNAEWAGLGLAPVNSVRIVDVTRDVGTRRLTLWLEVYRGSRWSLSLPLADTAFILPRLFAPAADTVAVAASIREAVRQRLFSGPMASVSIGGQAKILDVVASRVHDDTVKTVVFWGRPYLTLRAIESTYTCTIGETTNPERQVAAIAEVAFPDLWNLGAADSTMSGEFGFAINVHLKSNYSCVTEGSHDFVTIYVPADAAARYAAGAITGRELMARSLAMFNGNPVKLELAK